VEDSIVRSGEQQTRVWLKGKFPMTHSDAGMLRLNVHSQSTGELLGSFLPRTDKDNKTKLLRFEFKWSSDITNVEIKFSSPEGVKSLWTNEIFQRSEASPDNKKRKRLPDEMSSEENEQQIIPRYNHPPKVAEFHVNNTSNEYSCGITNGDEPQPKINNNYNSHLSTDNGQFQPSTNPFLVQNGSNVPNHTMHFPEVNFKRETNNYSDNNTNQSTNTSVMQQNGPYYQLETSSYAPQHYFTPQSTLIMHDHLTVRPAQHVERSQGVKTIPCQNFQQQYPVSQEYLQGNALPQYDGPTALQQHANTFIHGVRYDNSAYTSQHPMRTLPQFENTSQPQHHGTYTDLIPSTYVSQPLDIDEPNYPPIYRQEGTEPSVLLYESGFFDLPNNDDHESDEMEVQNGSYVENSYRETMYLSNKGDFY